MAVQQRRLLTAANSKLGAVDLSAILLKPAAWDELPLEIRQHLCSLLPQPRPDLGEPPHNPEVNPLLSRYGQIVKDELERWQVDLKNGLEGRSWRQEAMQAGKDRIEGKYDECKVAMKEEFWGRVSEEGNADPISEAKESEEKTIGDGAEAKAEANGVTDRTG